MWRNVHPPSSYRYPSPDHRTVSIGTNSRMSETSSTETSSNQAVPVAAPFRPRTSWTRSVDAVATNIVSTFVHGASPPTGALWFVNGNDSIARQAGRAVG